MKLETVKVAGKDAVAELNELRRAYPTTRIYPFLIGDESEMEIVLQGADHNPQIPDEIARASLSIDWDAWVAERRCDAEEYGFSESELLGDWPGELQNKGSISIHKNILNGKIKPEVFIGMATINEPWHLPAILKYGAWNDCPEPEIHCAIHRKWHDEFGAQIVGMSDDVIECIVENPPRNRDEALRLAWEQYWYCADIVDQGCTTVNRLAATLLNSDYWFFWWD